MSSEKKIEEKSDLLLCLGRLKDNYLALHSLISIAVHLKKTKPLHSLSVDQRHDFWRIQFSLLIEQVILSHCKLYEVKCRYGGILPEAERGRLNKYFTNDRVRALLRFRNKCSGHAIDKDTKAPLDVESLKGLIEEIFGKNDLLKNIVPTFFDEKYPNNPETIVGIIEEINRKLQPK
ncbi:hypothetical protein GH984_07400 [Spiribacter sp. C176]|uniref:HEPN AbiU2-like domain-containing protein n=1 Tax=Spiribacter salilacus TaxID=2664894 RepID=A0A6N7QSZ5_9GAMM|nr:hypothetical protein [Spiribacter salilacus]MRH78529.1 hypothetical protein [Spiribacter salilacus]